MASSSTQFDTDCKLMLHFDGADASTTFTDSSDSAHAMTAVGNSQIDTAQSKFSGASGLFDGTGDWLTTPDHADWDLGTGDFTIDFWVRWNSVANTRFFNPGSLGTLAVRFSNTNARWEVYLAAAEPTGTDTSHSPSANTWYHIAITRSGTNFRFFVDGTQAGTTKTDSSDVSVAATMYVGSQNGTESFNGWLDEFRFVKGTAVWTANFTAPSAAYSKVAKGGSRMMLMGVN